MTKIGENIFPRDIQALDVVETLGKRYQVGKVLFCDAYNNEYDESRSYCDCEFLDTSGGYHHWKSHLDGGRVIYFDDGDKFAGLSDEFMREITVETGVCLNVLKEYNISWETDILYFKINGNVATLYDNGEDMGFVDLCEDLCGDVDLIFKSLLDEIMGACKDCKYFFFPNKFSTTCYMFCEKTVGVSKLIKLRG